MCVSKCMCGCVCVLQQLRTIQAITTLLPQLTSEVQAQRYLDEFLDSCYAMVKRSSRSVLQVSSSGNRRSSGSASSSSSVSPPSAAAPAVVVPPVPPSSRSRAINVRISLQQMLKVVCVCVCRHQIIPFANRCH